MKIGISVTSAHRVEDVRLGSRYMIERARAARLAKLDSLFVGDHHVTAQPYYQNSPMLGRMLAEWGAMPAGALYLLPLWNPVGLAEQVATLSCLAEGRFIMQCGVGGDDAQFHGMGIPTGRRPSMFEQSLATLRSLWQGETVDLDGRWQLSGAHISPLPPEPVEVWIAAAAGVAIERAARLGDGWLGDPGMDFDTAEQRVQRYLDACQGAGRDPGAIAIRRDVYVGESAEAAQRAMAPYLERNYRGIAPEALLIGSVEQVAERISQLGRMGYTDVITRNITADQPQALATIERLGEVRGLLGGEP
jgi:alkanesulfonate monooxygenase SsuD/methylene tetrahydromethanopterin reductase-like flavin-dependent oxidoreductase (luciferase family)